MDLLHAQTIKDRYMAKMTLRMAEDKIASLDDAIMTCLVLDEELCKRNIANKIPDASKREEMKSSLFRVIRKISDIREENPNIESIESIAENSKMSSTYDAFKTLLDDTMGKRVAQYKTIINLISLQKGLDEQLLKDNYEAEIAKLELHLSNRDAELAAVVEQLQTRMESDANLSNRTHSQNPIDDQNNLEEITRLKSENTKHVERANKLEEQLNDSLSTQDNLKKNIAALEERLTQHLVVVESANQLTSDLDASQNSLMEATKKCKALEAYLENNKGDVEEAHDRKITELNAIIESLKEQISEQKSRAKNIVRELPTLSSSMITASGETDASLVALNMELKSKNKSLEDQVKILTRRLSCVQNS